MARRTDKVAENKCKNEFKSLIHGIKDENRNKKKQQRILHRNKKEEWGRLNNWLTLDNAGIIYPSIREENWDFVYRISTLLKEPVDSTILQRAVSDITPRFPSFFVKLKEGFFWTYLEEYRKPLIVEEESEFPCSKFKKGSANHLIRVLYYKNRISLECFHALADGRSSLKLLNSLIKHYMELKGFEFTSDIGCLNYLDKPRLEELEDSFQDYVDDSEKLEHKEVAAYPIKGTAEDFGVVNSTTAEMSVSQLKEIAKTYDCKMFELILASLAYAIWKKAKKDSKQPIKISVPIDLRQFFESESLRNFSGYLNVEIPIKKQYELTEIIAIVKQEMGKIDKPRMQGFINSNVAIKNNFFIKIIPLFLKNFFINMFFKVWGERYQTIAVSNLGLNKVPEEFNEMVDRFEVNLGRPKYNTKSMGLISYGDKLVCTISSKIKENFTEKDFIKTLSNIGVDILVESNRRDLYE